MLRYLICCDQCTKKYRKGEALCDGETVHIRRGRARLPFVCDDCVVQMYAGNRVNAVSLIPQGRVKVNWEHNYVFLEEG